MAFAIPKTFQIAGHTITVSGRKWLTAQKIETLVGLLCAQAGLSGGDVSIQPALLLVHLLTFGGAVFLLWKVFWKPLNRFMKNRSDRIEYDIRSAGELKTEAESLKRRWDEQMAEAEAKAQVIIQQGVEQGGRKRDEIVRDAEAEAKRRLDDAGDRIAEERRRTARERGCMVETQHAIIKVVSHPQPSG